jgi:hypothetical protein
MAYNKGESILFSIEKDLDVCHADLVVNNEQIQQMDFDESQVTEILPCSVPKANDMHQDMLAALQAFINKH